MISSFLPLIYAIVAPGGSNVPLIVGVFTLGCACLAAIAAYTAQETHRIHMNDLGEPGAVPVPREEYERIRASA